LTHELKKVNNVKSEVKALKVFNPFSGEVEELICTLDLHFLKSALVAASITKVVSEQGDDILEGLNNDKIDDMETEFVEEWK